MPNDMMTILPSAASALPDGFAARYGPWAVVTGASEGIGREFARTLAAGGLNVVLVARRAAELEALAEELRAAHGISARAHALDLSEAQAPQQLAELTSSLDVGLLVAAAGYGTSGPFIDAPLSAELAMIDVNVRAVAALCHVFANRFRVRGRGGFVLLSSLVAFQGVPRAANYAATKAWVQSFAEGFRAELLPLGIDVVATAPGPIHSGFGARAGMKMSLAAPASVVAGETLRALGRRTTVRPGRLSKLLEASLAFLPRWGRVRAMARVMDGMTRGPGDERPSLTASRR